MLSETNNLLEDKEINNHHSFTRTLFFKRKKKQKGNVSNATCSLGPFRHAHLQYDTDDINFLVERGYGVFYGHESIVISFTHPTIPYPTLRPLCFEIDYSTIPLACYPSNPRVLHIAKMLGVGRAFLSFSRRCEEGFPVILRQRGRRAFLSFSR